MEMSEHWKRVLQFCQNPDPNCQTCAHAKRQLRQIEAAKEPLTMYEDPYMELGGEG
jgi:hypothetical protein